MWNINIYSHILHVYINLVETQDDWDRSRKPKHQVNCGSRTKATDLSNRSEPGMMTFSGGNFCAPWRTSNKVHQRRSSQRFVWWENMFVVSTNDGTVYLTKKTKTNAIWIVDFQWIGRKKVNVSIVSIDNQRNRCLANLILNGQVQRENYPFCCINQLCHFE